MKEIENLKAQILKDYPRLTEDSEFKFACHKNVPCFNECCADVNIFLTPYDIIRLKKNLDITSTEVLKKYTISPFDENLKYPVLLLKMNDDKKKTCPFVGKNGCTVYPDRPWACRMYPLGMASPKDDNEELDKEFYFLLEENICQGFKEDHKYTVGEWLKDQGISEYNKMGEGFKELTLHKVFQKKQNLEPRKIEMFFLACYDIDRFRDFVFKSTFLTKFIVDKDTQKNIKEDDIALLNFGYKWLHFALFGEDTMTIKEDIKEAKTEALADEIRKRQKK